MWYITDAQLILVENRDFFHTPLHSAPPSGGSPSEYCHPVWFEKLEWRDYPMVKKILMIGLFVLTQLTNVTDRQTHIRTHRQTDSHRAYASHRAAKIVVNGQF